MASRDNLEAFLAGRRNLILAGTRPDGRPHLTPNWFYWDGQRFYVSTTRRRGKYAVFRRDHRSPEAVRVIDQLQQKSRDAGSADEVVIVGRTLFLHTPDGYGRSDLAAQLFRSSAQAAGTARNWATVGKLMAMLDAAG